MYTRVSDWWREEEQPKSHNTPSSCLSPPSRSRETPKALGHKLTQRVFLVLSPQCPACRLRLTCLRVDRGAGLPAIVVPCGVSDATDYTGLPIGLQLVGGSFKEAALLSLAHVYETTAPAVTRPQ